MATGRFDKFGPSRAAKSYEKQKWSRNGQRNEPSTSRYHRSARNFATILMAPTVLRVTDLKISNFSWSEPEIINIIKCIMIISLIPYVYIYIWIRPIIITQIIMLIISGSDQEKFFRWGPYHGGPENLEFLSFVTRKTVGAMRIVAKFRAGWW